MADASPFTTTPPWWYHERTDGAQITQAWVLDSAHRLVLSMDRPEPHMAQLLRQIAALPLLIHAVRNLIACDNTNFSRDGMRSVGAFDQAREALEAATGERLPHPNAGNTYDPLLMQRDRLREAVENARAWFGLFGEHGPAFGGEDAIDEQLRAALAYDPFKH